MIKYYSSVTESDLLSRRFCLFFHPSLVARRDVYRRRPCSRPSLSPLTTSSSATRSLAILFYLFPRCPPPPMVLLVQWPAVIEPRPISFPLLTDEYIHFVHHYSEPQIIDYYFYLNSFTYNLSKVVEKKLATKVERGTGIDALVLQFLFARLNLLTKKFFLTGN